MRRDTLHGESGDDRLVGGVGRDLLFGGADDDTFSFALASGTAESGITTATADTISDWSAPEDRVEASVATAVWSVLQGAAMVRVHDVKETVEALRLIGEPVMAEVA